MAIDKETIKTQLVNESNKILEKYNEMELVDSVSVMNMASKTVFLGSLRVYNEESVSAIKKDLQKQLNSFGNLTIREEKIFPCCAPNYIHISFNVSIDN